MTDSVFEQVRRRGLPTGGARENSERADAVVAASASCRAPGGREGATRRREGLSGSRVFAGQTCHRARTDGGRMPASIQRSHGEIQPSSRELRTIVHILENNPSAARARPSEDEAKFSVRSISCEVVVVSELDMPSAREDCANHRWRSFSSSQLLGALFTCVLIVPRVPL